VSYPKPPPEHEFEAELGLPEPLPADETILWQGSPNYWAMAHKVFYLGWLAAYLLLMLGLRAWWLLQEGLAPLAYLKAFAPALLLSVVGLGLWWMLAHFTAKTTLYTITTKRVVMRVGIVLSVTFNLPFKQLVAADVSVRKGNAQGVGSIALRLAESSKIALFHLWPHARPWFWKSPQPMLRLIDDANAVSKTLARAWQAQLGSPIHIEATQPPAELVQPVPAISSNL
jgi:Bacterial PH domain